MVSAEPDPAASAAGHGPAVRMLAAAAQSLADLTIVDDAFQKLAWALRSATNTWPAR